MPTLEDVLPNIDDQNRYQGATLKNLERKKEYLQRNVSCLIQDIIKCFEQRYVDLLDEAQEDATNETTEGYKSHICKILNSKVWPNEVSNVEKVMMKSSSPLSRHLRSILTNAYISGYFLSANKGRLFSYCTIRSCIFPTHLTTPLKLWQNIFELSSGGNDKDD